MRAPVSANILAALLLAGCASGGLLVPSMVQLLTEPGAFAGSEVRVRGYLAAPAGNLALFLTKEHAEISDHVSSIPVADATPDGHLILTCTGYYAVVDGTLRKRSDAPLIVLSSGVSLRYIIADVQRVLIHQGGAWETCWPPEGDERK